MATKLQNIQQSLEKAHLSLLLVKLLADEIGLSPSGRANKKLSRINNILEEALSTTSIIVAGKDVVSSVSSDQKKLLKAQSAKEVKSAESKTKLK